jgi:hypothetical protein
MEIDLTSKAETSLTAINDADLLTRWTALLDAMKGLGGTDKTTVQLSGPIKAAYVATVTELRTRGLL